jgi:hypothetical protein
MQARAYKQAASTAAIRRYRLRFRWSRQLQKISGRVVQSFEYRNLFCINRPYEPLEPVKVNCVGDDDQIPHGKITQSKQKNRLTLSLHGIDLTVDDDTAPRHFHTLQHCANVARFEKKITQIVDRAQNE